MCRAPRCYQCRTALLRGNEGLQSAVNAVPAHHALHRPLDGSFGPGRCKKDPKFTLELRGGSCKLKKGLDKSQVNAVLIIFEQGPSQRIRQEFSLVLAMGMQWRADAF